ncbi:alpha/beta hydrolase [Phenylobacterium sp.]|uniref:alpha/beta hydrolase n=1 Tax=Phenylobacterium sp. TaxID=1871053 RepID=UPI002737A869|nr:alpha/beta fold hydrolase [Phenylobacterium sp.]MDP3870848.1 alpha/beta fold hydrolase [Phenylobacterium sp.]
MGHPVVLIHGMWCTAGHLAKVNDLLAARGYDCRSLTLPGHVAGPRQSEEVGALSIKDYVQAALAFIREQNFSQPPILLGHSMGGLIAQRVAAEINTAALVLLTPAAPAGINSIKPDVLAATFPVFSRWGFWKKPHKLSAERLRLYAANGLHFSYQDKLISSLVYESGRALSEIAFWWADGGHATRVPAGAVRCPVYVVSAGQDKLTPASVVRKVVARYPGATHRHWPERGHWVIDDLDTEDMVHEIDGWLRPILTRATREPIKVARV